MSSAPNFKSKPMIDRTIGPGFARAVGRVCHRAFSGVRRAQMTVRELLALEPGAVLMLDRPLKSPWF